jgi:PAS domain-containing protein
MGITGRGGDKDDRELLRGRVEHLEQGIAQLRGSEKRLRILFEDAPDRYYLSDLRGTFVDGNAAAEAITGHARGELIGKSFLTLNLLSPADLPRAASLLARNLLGARPGPTSSRSSAKMEPACPWRHEPTP